MTMTRNFVFATAVAILAVGAAPAAAQDPGHPSAGTSATATTEPVPVQDDQAKKTTWRDGREQSLQYIRFMDQRGLNQFETTKTPGVEFTSFKFELAAAFTSQVQNLGHQNTAVPNVVNNVNTNQLQDIGFGFNTSTANLYLNAQIAPGIRVALTTYLSSRHHNETWVKDGYLQIDESPLDLAPLKALFDVATVKVGHMEINYGDAHFRRSDNGQALYNPFVGNYIMDAFTTEIGAEVYLKPGPFLAMAAITGGEIRGTVLTPGQRGPAYIGKAGVDTQVNDDLRVRLTGSFYKTNKALSNTLYGGDRAGSRYYWVMENTAATETGNATSGYINPGFRNKVQAMVLNPFVKVLGAELFGVIERARGKALAETSEREWTQVAVDAVYRFLPKEAAYVGARYNRAEGTVAGITGDVGAERWQISAGWFVLPGVLAKAEYVNQKYNGYPATNIRSGGRFSGLMVEGVVAF